MRNTIPLSTLLERPAGTEDNPHWINDDIECIIESVESKDGRWKAKLVDPLGDARCSGSFGSVDPSKYTGKSVIIGGKGNLLKEYKGHKFVQIGKNAELCATGKPAPAGPTARPASTPAEIHPSNVAHAESKPHPVGPTIGMALNNATNYIIAKNLALTDDELFERASVIIRVSQRLEKGELANVAAENPF